MRARYKKNQSLKRKEKQEAGKTFSSTKDGMQKKKNSHEIIDH
jgi:hypothetical protein